MTTEEKIFEEAEKIFLLYGYHGSTISSIANAAHVNKTAIHYYFRNKEKLYQKIIIKIAESIEDKAIVDDVKLFIFIIKELQNNKTFFLKSLARYSTIDWNTQLIALIKNTFDKITPERFIEILN